MGWRISDIVKISFIIYKNKNQSVMSLIVIKDGGVKDEVVSRVR